MQHACNMIARTPSKAAPPQLRPSRARHAADRRAAPHQHALVRSLSGIETEVSGERTLQDPHLSAGLEPGALRQLDQPVALALTQVIDDLTGTRAGRISSMIRLMTPMLQRAAHHCASAPGVRPPSTTLGNPPEPIARSAEPRLSCGAWFGLGFVGSPVGNTTGDFLLALDLVARAASSAASSCSLSCPANRCRPPSVPRQ